MHPENTRRLSDKEFQDRKKRGLCFRCDEKWRIGHICKNKGLSVLIVNDEDTLELSSNDETANEEVTVDTPMAISLNSVVGIDNPKTMKLRGSIAGEKVVVMLEPGATHNFISPQLITKLQRLMTTTEEFGVTLGTRTKVFGDDICKNVKAWKYAMTFFS